MDQKTFENKEVNINTLQNELSDRRRSLSEIRGTAYKIIAAISAAGITLFWILIKENDLSVFKAIIITLFVNIIAYLISKTLSSLNRGFLTTKEILSKVEERLNLYSSDILPEEYKRTVSKKTDFLPLANHFLKVIVIAVNIALWVPFIGNAFKPNENIELQVKEKKTNNFILSVDSGNIDTINFKIKYCKGEKK